MHRRRRRPALALAAAALLLATHAARATAALPMPQQAHVAWGARPDELVLCWATPTSKPPTPDNAGAGDGSATGPTDPPQAVAWYSQCACGSCALLTNASQLAMQVPAQWNATGPGAYSQHRVTLRSLPTSPPGDSCIAYSVGWAGAIEQAPPPHQVPVAPRNDTSWRPRLAMFGDLGWTDDQVLPYLRAEAEAGTLDGAVLFGDMVYWDNGENENAFMRDVSNLTGAGAVPVMTTPGNGDAGGNFSRYRLQFAMPGWDDDASPTASLYHAFEAGPALVVGINTEVLGYWSFAPQAMLTRQLNWLEATLAAANEPAARAARPWIVVHFHRPAYSTGNTDARPYEVYEPLMHKYGVDLVWAGHVHNQERTLPVFNSTVLAGLTPGHPYHDARAPTYVVSGNPGNAEETNYFRKGFDAWTAWRSYHYGYAVMEVHNASALTVQFVSTNTGGKVSDATTLTKTRACNFGDACAARDAVLAGSPVPVPMEGAGGGSSTLALSSPLSQTPRAVRAAAARRRARRQLERRPGDNAGMRNHAGPVQVPAAQRAALVDLFTATAGATRWVRSDGWLQGDPCTGGADGDGWYGVSCARVTERLLPSLWNTTIPGSGVDPLPHGVTALQLPSNNLTGQLPSGMGAALAPSLQLLDLSSNLLTGSVPRSLFAMPRLHSLFLSPRDDNSTALQLTGSLPDDIGAPTGLPSLRYLGLNRLGLTGGIPASLGELECSVTSASASSPACLLWLVGNDLTGPVPHGMCNATYNEVYVGGNAGLTCPRPCVKVAYGQWPDCPGACTPC